MQTLFRSQQQRSEFRATQFRAMEHMRRCAQLPPLRKGEAERLVSEYLATNAPKIGPSPASFADSNNLSIGWGVR